MNNQLPEKILELYNSTPDNVVSVSYGYKVKGGEETGDLAVIFHVKKKLPLASLDTKEILPSSVESEGFVYKTDVQENDLKVELVSNCYQANDSSSAAYRSGYRPLRGGTSFSNYVPGQYIAGTLGGIFLDTTDNTVVGLTCSHIMVGDYTLNINKPNNSANYAADYSNMVAYQPGTGDGGLNLGLDPVGFLKRYYVVRTDGSSNFMDIGVVGIGGNVTANTLLDADSIKQLNTNYAPKIATSSEISNLLISPRPVLEKYGRSTGGIGGSSCPIYVTGLGVAVAISIPVQNTYMTAVYYNCILFRYSNTDSNGKVYGNVMYPGDSGSLLIADFNGTKKIVGVCFASGTTSNENQYSYGYACRMDLVASEMKIADWDGVSGKYSDITKRQTTTTSGRGYDKTKTINGKLYWQIGTAANNSSTLDDKWITFEPDAPGVGGGTVRNTSTIKLGASSANKFMFNGQTVYQKN